MKGINFKQETLQAEPASDWADNDQREAHVYQNLTINVKKKWELLSKKILP